MLVLTDAVEVDTVYTRHGICSGDGHHLNYEPKAGKRTRFTTMTDNRGEINGASMKGR